MDLVYIINLEYAKNQKNCAILLPFLIAYDDKLYMSPEKKTRSPPL